MPFLFSLFFLGIISFIMKMPICYRNGKSNEVKEFEGKGDCSSYQSGKSQKYGKIQ